ncbi:hypothetical protein EFL26_21035 [Nocardioides pocheonensis]|uniref:Uncharacterized protein n=1 Tax=Nocardioides pocheonensis TaxID=661485 RepID=A0A3N0GGR1_9ACTN|nr:hypothetical protein EFL26_21035 [Nocardioides pocheonensis]
MRRLFLGVLTAVLLLGGPVCVPVQAASPYGSVTGISGVLYDDCGSYPFRYSVDVPGGGDYRALNLQLVAPDGSQADTAYVVPDANLASGTGAFRLCRPTDPYGTYTIRGTVEWAPTVDAAKTSAPLDDAHFTMRKPSSRTSVAASTRRPAYGQVVAYRFRSLLEEPSGYAPDAFAWVHLEKRVAGRWVRVKGGRAMTHGTGAVTVRLRYLAHHHRTWLRAVTEPSPRYARSVSPPLRLW